MILDSTGIEPQGDKGFMEIFFFPPPPPLPPPHGDFVAQHAEGS